MSIKILSRCIGLLLVHMLIASTSIAQDAGFRQQAKSPSLRVAKTIKNSDYSYTIFSSPDKAVGYAVFHKGAQVFQQHSLKFLNSNGYMYYLNSVEVEKAAAFTIQKLRKGKYPLLSMNELKSIALQ